MDKIYLQMRGQGANLFAKHLFANTFAQIYLDKIYLQIRGQGVNLCAGLSCLLVTPLGINLAPAGPLSIKYMFLHISIPRYLDIKRYLTHISWPALHLYICSCISRYQMCKERYLKIYYIHNILVG